jgi:hypothetical protein
LCPILFITLSPFQLAPFVGSAVDTVFPYKYEDQDSCKQTKIRKNIDINKNGRKAESTWQRKEERKE